MDGWMECSPFNWIIIIWYGVAASDGSTHLSKSIMWQLIIPFHPRWPVTPAALSRLCWLWTSESWRAACNGKRLRSCKHNYFSSFCLITLLNVSAASLFDSFPSQAQCLESLSSGKFPSHLWLGVFVCLAFPLIARDLQITSQLAVISIEQKDWKIKMENYWKVILKMILNILFIFFRSFFQFIQHYFTLS